MYIMLSLAPEHAARLLVVAARRVGTLRVLYDPDQPRDEQGQWTSTGGKAPDLGEADLPSFDENDEHSPEWRTILKHDNFLDQLDEAEEDDQVKMKEALDAYVHDADHLNAALRANPDLIDEDEEDNDEDEEEFGRPGRRITRSLGQIASELENAMADAPKIKEPVTVYRGLRGVSVDDLVAAPTIQLNGFQSTSFDPKVAARFMGEKVGGLVRGENLSGVLLKITAGYGLALGHAHSIDGEMEMLLPHGSTYDVLGVSRVRHGGQTFPMVHLKQR